VFNRQTLSSSF